MSPQKLLFCYHVPTRGRAGVKLGDAWYVSNVSIIFDALCLFLHHLLWVFYTSWRFYAFYRTNLLTRCHSASSLFSAILVFQKSYTGNIIRIGWNKSRTSYFYRSFTKTEDEMEGGQGQPHHRGARPSPWPCPPMVRVPSPLPDAAPSPIYSPQPEKPKGWISFSWNILLAAAIIVVRSGGSRSSSRHPVEGLLHHHGRLWSDVWVVYLGLWVHSSS
jgi:hypothetical protein